MINGQFQELGSHSQHVSRTQDGSGLSLALYASRFIEIIETSGLSVQSSIPKQYCLVKIVLLLTISQALKGDIEQHTQSYETEVRSTKTLDIILLYRICSISSCHLLGDSTCIKTEFSLTVNPESRVGIK